MKINLFSIKEFMRGTRPTDLSAAKHQPRQAAATRSPKQSMLLLMPKPAWLFHFLRRQSPPPPPPPATALESPRAILAVLLIAVLAAFGGLITEEARPLVAIARIIARLRQSRGSSADAKSATQLSDRSSRLDDAELAVLVPLLSALPAECLRNAACVSRAWAAACSSDDSALWRGLVLRRTAVPGGQRREERTTTPTYPLPCSVVLGAGRG